MFIIFFRYVYFDSSKNKSRSALSSFIFSSKYFKLMVKMMDDKENKQHC